MQKQPPLPPFLFRRLAVAILAVSLALPAVAQQQANSATKQGNRAAVLRANSHLTSTPLIPGAIATFEFEKAAPAATLALIYSLQGYDPSQIPNCPDLFSPLKLAQLQGLGQTDGFGNATFYVYVPAVGMGLPVWIQGLDNEYCTLSNALSAVMDGTPTIPYIQVEPSNDPETIPYGEGKSVVATVNGNISVSDTGDANGTAVVQIPGLPDGDVTITANAFSIELGTTTMDFRTLGNDDNVSVNGVLTPITTVIDQYAADIKAGLAMANWHTHSKLMLAAIAMASTPSWRANTVTSQYEAGAPPIWRKDSSITGAASVYSMTHIGCSVLQTECAGKEAIHRGGVSLLTQVLVPECTTQGLDTAALCYSYTNDIWN